MNFASYDFWSLLTVCFVVSRLLMTLAKTVSPELENLAGKLCLAATGLILLGSESWLTLAVFLWVVGLSWIGVLVASKPGFDKNSLISRVVFVVLLTGQLAPLFYYKYWTFVMNDWLGLGLKQASIAIPMGLSFYTFQKIGFWIDTIRNPGTRPKFLDYLNFCSFFPQIVAGPIEKKASLLPQIETIRFKIHRTNLESALRWIIVGLAYKLVIADNIGSLSEKLRIDPANAWQVWFECFAFALRIYFDFAGYSFIAVGLGLLVGVHLTLNFRCPYWSSDLREFWRNWHITLGAWLRDYVYLPLGGRRSSRWILNIVIVFLVSGLWHGAGWGFLIWGLMHGIGVAFCGLGKPWTKLGPLRWAVTFAYTTAAWLFFFETDPVEMKAKALSLINPLAYGIDSLRNLPQVIAGPTHGLTLGMILLIALGFLFLEGLGTRRNFEPYYFLRKSAVCMILVFLTVFLAPMEESKFIYFNF
jgi:D-alanyl-lipoteichoic acid acyltransferase DltB (MBOAT superfamily)